MKHWMFFMIMLSLMSGALPKSTEPVDIVHNGARLQWTSCWFNIPPSKTVHCAYLFPSKNNDETKEVVRLPVVVIKNHTSSNPKTGPLLYLSGGPGASTGLDEQSIENWWNWVEKNDWTSEVVLFDQRGTGLSQPHLECPQITAMIYDILGKALASQEELSRWKQATQKCYTSLRQQGVNLSSYTSTQNSHDVGELMELLGGDQWNLYGVSYGTRLALNVVREYPERIRSVVLDSVYPPEIDEFIELPFIYDNAMETLFRGCQSDTSCKKAFPNLESSFHALLKKFKESPVKFTVPDPNIDRNIEVLINDDRLMEVVFYSLYSWDITQTLPVALEMSLRGDYEKLQLLVEDYADWLLNKDFSQAVYLSVECHDSDPTLTREQFLAQVAQFPRSQRFVEHQWDYNLCHVWQVGHAKKQFREPVSSQIPTLFLSGQYDPVTPPLWARRAASHFHHGYFIMLPSVGHGTVETDFCASEVVRDFLRIPHQQPKNECLSWPSDSNFTVEAY